MIDLERLEKLSRTLDFTPDQWMSTMKLAADFGAHFLGEQPSAQAFYTPKAIASGRPSPPNHPESIEKVLNDFSDLALQSGIEPTSGRFFGYIPGGGMPAAALGDLIAALTNRYSGVQGVCPGAVEIENQVIRWIRLLLNWPEESWGTLQSGGSMATLTALIAARATRPPDHWSKSVIYCSEEAHHCFQKAVAIAGLEYCPFYKIPSDSQGRLSISHLKDQIEKDRKSGLSPWILCATAGSTNLGAIDPLQDCAELCRQEKLWMHVDAAYGGFFWLTEEGKKRLSGMELGDSIVLDPHKGLFQPYGLGIALVRNGAFLRRSLSSKASYLQDLAHDTEHSPNDYSPELTRHFRALRLWFSLKIHGMEAFEAAIDEKLMLASYLHGELSKLSELTVYGPPALSVVAFRCTGDTLEQSNSRTEKLFSKIMSSGRVHFSSTTIRGFLYLRICILSFRTHLTEVQAAVEEIKKSLP
jgi:glutamate/tyrosine decarboxylase-like PLP-dependent enzyme